MYPAGIQIVKPDNGPSVNYLNPTPTPNIGDQVKNERHFLVSLVLLSKMLVRGS